MTKSHFGLIESKSVFSIVNLSLLGLTLSKQYKIFLTNNKDGSILNLFKLSQYSTSAVSVSKYIHFLSFPPIINTYLFGIKIIL